MKEVIASQKKIEANFWHNHYDYILKRCNDLGQQTLQKYIKPEEMRNLSRREETNPIGWRRLPKSAEASDDSLALAKFTNPLLI